MTVDEQLAERVVRKVEYIEEALGVLTEKQSLGPDEYVDSRDVKDVVERRLETVSQACIDIARVLLSALGVQQAESNAGAFRQLDQRDVLTEATAEKLADAARFRNVLAHEYGPVIDDGQVYEALQDLTRYRDFLHEVREFLHERGAL